MTVCVLQHAGAIKRPRSKVKTGNRVKFDSLNKELWLCLNYERKQRKPSGSVNVYVRGNGKDSISLVSALLQISARFAFGASLRPKWCDMMKAFVFKAWSIEHVEATVDMLKFQFPYIQYAIDAPLLIEFKSVARY